MKHFKQPKNLQERIFALIRELGMSVGEKCELTYAMFGKRHVCHLTREQGLMLEGFLQGCVDRGQKPTVEEGAMAIAPPATIKR